MEIHKENGVLHRLDGPAVIFKDDTGYTEEHWYINGKITRKKDRDWDRWFDEDYRPHRLDGPAEINSDGKEAWYIHGKSHRLDGPAYTFPRHKPLWCYQDNEYPFNVWCEVVGLPEAERVLLKMTYL